MKNLQTRITALGFFCILSTAAFFLFAVAVAQNSSPSCEHRLIAAQSLIDQNSRISIEREAQFRMQLQLQDDQLKALQHQLDEINNKVKE